MKIFKTITICALLIWVLTGCIDDILNKSPELAFSEENAFENFQVAETYAFGFYNIFPGYDLSVVNNEWNADLLMNNNAPQGSNWIWNRVTVPTTSGIWNFSFVRRVNIMLQNLENSSMSQVEIDHWKSIGYFFRAYDYFNKLAAYGDVPWLDRVVSDADEEILYGERTPREEVTRNMLNDLQFAEQHIIDPGNNGIPENSISQDVVRALISRFGLFEGTWRKYHGLNDADMYLRASADASASLIEKHPELHPNYNEVFNSASLNGVPGILLYKEHEVGILTHILTSRHRNSAGNWDLTKKAADMYLLTDGQTRWNSLLFETDQDPYAEFRNRDLRMLYTIVPPFRVEPVSGDRLAWEETGDPKHREYIDLMAEISSETQKYLPSRNWAGFILRVSPHFRDYNEGDPFNVSRTGYNLFKYYNRLHDVQNIDYNDAPIFRMGEVMANHAEVKWELGEFDQSVADQTINKLRERGGVAPMNVGTINAGFDPTRSPDVEPVLWEIRRERAIELMAEGFRFDDLRRWRKMDYTDEPKLGRWIRSEDVGGQLPIQDGAGEGYIQFFPGTPPAFPDHYYLHPIPSEERALNPNLTQNTGW